MDKMPDKKRIEALTQLLMRINEGKDPRILRREATRLIDGISDTDINLAEQNLVRDGYSVQLVQQLSAVFVLMAILEGQSENLKSSLPENHVLRKILAEHELIRCFLVDFKDTVDDVLRSRNLSDTSSEFMKLSHIIEHLSAMEEHVDREEDVIFPCLKKHGWSSLCRSAGNEHIYIKAAIGELVKLISSFSTAKTAQFKDKLGELTKHLSPLMAEHLFQEDNILFPIALEVIKDESVWVRMKKVCDDIGYCGVHI